MNYTQTGVYQLDLQKEYITHFFIVQHFINS